MDRTAEIVHTGMQRAAAYVGKPPELRRAYADGARAMGTFLSGAVADLEQFLIDNQADGPERKACLLTLQSMRRHIDLADRAVVPPGMEP